MAQVFLSGIGTALAGPFGGIVGNTLGAAADKTFVNSLSSARQVGARITGLQLNQASQGDPVKQVFGRARVAGTVIWAARLKENRSTTRASKTAPKTETYSYSLSFAVGLCEGPIGGIGRVWADGQPIDLSKMAYRLYLGDETQTPDALIEAIEGTAPAYRGLAYLVFEDLDITPYGNRPPNLSVEVFRRAPVDDLESLIQGVCLIPGAGEFIYATAPNAALSGLTGAAFETQHAGDGRTDFVVSLDQLQAQLPNVGRVTLVIGWFGDSLDAGACRVKPGVEAAVKRTAPLVWSVSGCGRGDAHLISTIDLDSVGRTAYGGTPSDQVVIDAIRELNRRGFEVTLLPFILMDCVGYPWRGRITSDADLTAGAAADVAAFMGVAEASDFTVTDGTVTYSGPDEWTFRRFVLHVAALGEAAGGGWSDSGGVLLGSELRGLTMVRSAVNSYPMVAALRDLAAQVRLLTSASISYGADWSEYFGHQPADGSGHVAFHLDPLWTDANIDYVGIDWYAPLTDWRDGITHLDHALAASIYDEAYLQGRIRAGEGFDWYYASDAARLSQTRTNIADGVYNEPWVFRPKDIVSWWSNTHHDRPNGVRSGTATAWVPQSKPIRFVEIGCAAIDKGPNAPNLFLDPKSSESAIPPFSSGERDDRIQRAYLKAFAHFYAANNPVSSVYHEAMLSGMNVWCWDARPYPAFPQRSEVWGDTNNWRTGHWLNGRMGSGEAHGVIATIAAQAGVPAEQLDLSEVSGSIDGYVVEQPMAAADALKPVLDYLGLEAAERGGKIGFIGGTHGVDAELLRGDLAYREQNPLLARRDLVEVPASLTLRCYDLDRDYQVQAVFVRRDDVAGASQVSLDLPLCLSHAQATSYATYALQRLQGVRETVTVDADPLSLLQFEAGDGLTLEGEAGVFRVTAIDWSEMPRLTLEPVIDGPALVYAEPGGGTQLAPLSLVIGFTLLELPCFGTDETNVLPILAPSAAPWTGVDVYAGSSAGTLRLRGRVEQMPSFGVTLAALPAQRGEVLLPGAALDIHLEGEAPVSVSAEALRAGANFICVKALNEEWEIIQFLTATTLSPQTYRLTGLVRGQWGSEQARLAGIGEGAEAILLPPDIVRADMTLDERGLDRLWRTGKRGFGGAIDGALDVQAAAWTGLALRPRAPVLGWIEAAGADVRISWIRRARYSGDNWDNEPPLCEDYELYRIDIYDGAALKRSAEVTATQYMYAAADIAADFPGGFDADSRVEIAQKSQVYGYGPVLKVGLG